MSNPERVLNLDPTGNFMATGYNSGWDSLFNFLLPEGIRGTRTLDIGAGMSDITSNLRERGANAIAIDLLYAGFNPFLYEINPNSTGNEVADIFKDRRERFLKDVQKNPNEYIAATASNLPFRPESFDAVYSNGCVSSMLMAGDWKSFTVAINEIFRILKPYGKGILNPFDEVRGNNSQRRRFKSNKERFLKRLESKGHKFKELNFKSPDGTLTPIFTFQRTNKPLPF